MKPRKRGPLATPPPDNPRKRQMEWESVESPGEEAAEAARRRLAALDQIENPPGAEEEDGGENAH